MYPRSGAGHQRLRRWSRGSDFSWPTGAESGVFLLDGLTQATGLEILVDAADLASLELGSDDLYVRAFDGLAWSDWTSFKVTATDDIVI